MTDTDQLKMNLRLIIGATVVRVGLWIWPDGNRLEDTDVHPNQSSSARLARCEGADGSRLTRAHDRNRYFGKQCDWDLLSGAAVLN
jgi:hypothetical protein